MRTEKEIKDQMEKAMSWTMPEETNYPALSYENGVEDMARWLLEENMLEPIEKEYYDNTDE